MGITAYDKAYILHFFQR